VDSFLNALLVYIKIFLRIQGSVQTWSIRGFLYTTYLKQKSLVFVQLFIIMQVLCSNLTKHILLVYIVFMYIVLV
jgi:hypothetical protein